MWVAALWPASSADAATVTWKTTPADQSWSNGANWLGGVPPASGDAVVFPASSTNKNSNNNLPGLSLVSITFDGNGYTLTGVPVTIGAAGVTCSTGAAPQQNMVGVGIVLGADATVTTAAGCELLLGGSISGAHSLTKTGPGALQLSAPNTFAGMLLIVDGQLEASGNASLGAGDGTPSTGTSVSNGGTLKITAATIPNERLDLQGAGAGAGALIGNGPSGWNGPIVLSSASTISAGGLFTIGGAISGPFNLILSGGSPGIVLTGISSYSGTTTVTNGRVFVNGSLAGTTTVNVDGTGILGGTGLVDGNVNAVGNIAPGQSPGILTTQNVSMVPGADLVSELNGPVAGAQYDQLAVHGTVNLGGADLNVQMGFVPSTGQQFLLLDNDGADPITGTFNGLPEGASAIFNGSPFTVSYVGGDGNDVVLTAGTGVPALSSVQVLCLAAFLAGTAAWQMRRRGLRL